MRTLALWLLLTLPAAAQFPLVGEAPPQRRLVLHMSTDKSEYAIGDLMKVSVRSAQSGYILVFWVDSRGKVQLAVPSEFSPYDRVYAGQSLQIRDNQGRLLEQKGPPGQETLQVILTRERLDLKSLEGLLKSDPAAFVQRLQAELARRPGYGQATVRYTVR